MGDFESSKNLAAIGSLLMLIPGVSIVGAILVFIGMKGLSEYYKDDNIFNGVLKGIICGVIGKICAVAACAAVWVVVIGGAVLGGASSIHYYGNTYASATGIFSGIIFGIIAAIVLLIVAFVFMLLMAKNLRRAFNALGDRSGVNLFRTAGTLLWIGAILTIIGIGAFLILITYILLIVAFFSLKEKAPNQTCNYTPPPTVSTSNTKTANFCPNCGTAVAPQATFCSHCGKQI
ncbi:MAG: DUF996 domain-containing protein [Nitrososphaerota archaeon]|jgi:uncharacterized membrane protein|nr:DUF996 domain-containing protein [Nitrososphaerota archaeon]